MRLRSALLGTAFAFACGGAFGGAAHAAQLDGWYVGLEGGAGVIEDWNHILDVATPASATFDTGWLALGTVGFAWQNHLRVEFEAGYRSNNLDTYVDGGTPDPAISGDLWEATAMANLLYDLYLTDDLSLSLGAGVGGDFANFTRTDGATSAEDDQWNLAYQGIAGVNYSIAQQTSLFVNYRYLRVVSPEFEFAPALTDSFHDGDDFVKHALTIGLRYAFEATQAYVESAPPPPPAAPMSAAPRQFIVFFGFNKYNLTSEAMRVISEAVVAARDTGSASLLITGHTDTVGSNQFNERLSMRRANAVKGEMVRQGIPTAAITTTGKGETELLVQTADGVKEPQNRRATIDLN